MPTKKQVRKTSENIIEKELGVRLYKLQGSLDCQIAPFVRTSWNGQQYMVGHVAASLLTSIPPSEITRVTNTCGIKNCVSANHLVVNGDPLVEYKEGGTFKAKQDKDIPDEVGYIHDCTPELWSKMNDEEKERARKGTFNISLESYAIHGRQPSSD